MSDDVPTQGNWAENVADLAKALAPFLPRFRNLRKVRERLLGDVSDAAFDALVARLRLSQARSHAKAVGAIVDGSGIPPAIAQEMVSRQEAIDTIVADALLRIARDTKPDADATEGSDATGGTSDDDWFDVYRREAADRSAGEMREAFVRVLEGEIRQPGAFSVQTLRTLGTIGTATAASFRRAASVSISNGASDARVPAVGGKLGENCLSDIGLSFDALTRLTENGLLHPDYACWWQYGAIHEANPGKDIPPNAQVPFRHQAARWVLLGASEALATKSLRVEGAAFTTAGRELLKVVEIERMPEFTQRLKAHFARSEYEMVEVAATESEDSIVFPK